MKTLFRAVLALLLLVAAPALGGISVKKGGGGPTCSKVIYTDTTTSDTTTLAFLTPIPMDNLHAQITETYDRLGDWRLGADDKIEFCYACASAADDCTLVTGASSASFAFRLDLAYSASAAGVHTVNLRKKAQEGVSSGSTSVGPVAQASTSANAEWEFLSIAGAATAATAVMDPGDCVAPIMESVVGAGSVASYTYWQFSIEQLDCVDRGP